MLHIRILYKYRPPHTWDEEWRLIIPPFLVSWYDERPSLSSWFMNDIYCPKEEKWWKHWSNDHGQKYLSWIMLSDTAYIAVGFLSNNNQIIDISFELDVLNPLKIATRMLLGKGDFNLKIFSRVFSRFFDLFLSPLKNTFKK